MDKREISPQKVNTHFTISIIAFSGSVLIALFLIYKIFVALNTPCHNSWDPRTKSNIDAVRAYADIWYEDKNSYQGICDSENLQKIKVKILEMGQESHCFSSADSVCMEADLRSGGEWCADSTGYSGTTANCAIDHMLCQ